jgi:hypothetical protein
MLALSGPGPDLAWPGPGLAWPLALAWPWPGLSPGPGPGLAWPDLGLGPGTDLVLQPGPARRLLLARGFQPWPWPGLADRWRNLAWPGPGHGPWLPALALTPQSLALALALAWPGLA